MAANGISTLPTKEARQIAKLELAQTKRQLTGTQGYRESRYYDLDLLPTQYNGNTLVNNPNVGGLQQGRPWKATPNILSGLWRTTYAGYFDDDWTWFDSQTPTESIAVADFSLYDGDIFSTQWLGYFKAPHTANYTFYLESDDRSQFWLGDKAITGYDDGNWDVYAFAGEGEFSSDPISLVAGQYYPIRLQFGNAGGPSSLNFSWSDDYEITQNGMVLWLQTWDSWIDPGNWTNKLDSDFPGLYNATTLNPPTGEPNLLPVLVMQFGGNGQYWDVNNPTTGDFTVGVWFNTTSILGTGSNFFDNPSLVGSDSGGLANDWGFCIKNGQIGFGGVSGQTAFTTGQFNDGTWHYAVATRVKTTGAMTVFVDGVQLAQITEAPGAELTATPTIRIGGDPVNTTFYEGYMAEVQFYQIALTPVEIAGNFTIQRGIYGV